MHGEIVVRVGERRDRPPAGGLRELLERLDRVLVGILGVDRLAAREGEVAAGDTYGLRAQAFEMHLDAMIRRVVERAMAECGEVEVTPELAVHAAQDIEVELRRDA